MNPLVISIGVVAGVVILYLVSMMFQIKFRDDQYGLELVGGKRGDHMVELFTLGSAPLNYGMGPLSNISIRNKSGSHMQRHPDGIVKSTKLYVPSGTPLPINPSVSIDENLVGPNVDGTVNTPRSLAMFKHNRCLPECCPGTYSCSGGCVCQTKNQAEFINKRGNNRTAPSEI